MSLKPSGQNKLLTVEQVINVRKLFYEKNWSYFDIEDATGIKYSQLRKAIHGRGKFYASIEDGIPQEVKDNRRSIKVIRGTFNDGRQWQKYESESSAARHRREAEEEEAKQKAKQEEERRKLIERLIREDQLKKNK